MKKFWSVFKDSPIIFVFCKKKRSNFILFSLVLLVNAFAALMEGLSFGVILLAFSVISGENFSGNYFLSRFAGFLPQSNESQFVFLIIFAILFQVLRSGMSYIGQIIMNSLSIRIQTELQEEVHRQIFSLSFSCLNRYKIGDLAEYARTPSSVITYLMEAVNFILVSIFMIIGSFIVLSLISFPLTLVTMSILCILAVFQRLVFHVISSESKTLSEWMFALTKHSVEYLHNIRLIHLFDRQNHVLNKIREKLNGITLSTKKLSMWKQSIAPLNEATGILLVGLTMIAGVFILNKPEMSTPILPLLLTFLAVTYRMVNRFLNLMVYTGVVANFNGQIEKIGEILNTKDKEFIIQGAKLFKSFQHQIEFKDVSLSYASNSQYALKDISLVIPKGLTIALVGASGAGKSSLADLLVRLYDPTFGTIKIDDQNINELDMGSWRSALGVVSQETYLFNETITENIRFGKLDATEEDIIAASKIAGSHEFIMSTPQGYQTLVGERGFRLSGGERQRIALARALIRKPQVLILDEATSNLDSDSEYLIQQAIKSLHGEVTIIIIAHRLATIAHADQIVVLDKGEIIESGIHHELIQKEGKYSYLWLLQSHKHSDKYTLEPSLV